MQLQRLRLQRIAGPLVVTWLLLAGAPAAWAGPIVPTIYNYTGNPFTNGDRLTATLELADPLAPNLSLATVTPLSFSVSASPTSGPPTLMLTNNSPNLTPAGFNFFRFSTDSNGTITDWSFSVHQSTSNPINCTTGATDCLAFVSNTNIDDARQWINGSVTYIRQVQNPGTWSVVPEPSTLAMSALGLLAFGASRRRRHGPGGDADRQGARRAGDRDGRGARRGAP